MPVVDAAGHQGALEKVLGFTLHEHAVALAPEIRFGQIVEEKKTAHHFANEGATFEHRRGLRGATMPVKYRDRRTIAKLER